MLIHSKRWEPLPEITCYIWTCLSRQLRSSLLASTLNFPATVILFKLMYPRDFVLNCTALYNVLIILSVLVFPDCNGSFWKILTPFYNSPPTPTPSTTLRGTQQVLSIYWRLQIPFQVAALNLTPNPLLCEDFLMERTESNTSLLW